MQAHLSGPCFLFFICAFPGCFLLGRQTRDLAFSEHKTANTQVAYRPRALESVLAAYVDTFSAVLLTGPRQAGETTLLRHFARGRFGEDLAMVSLDIPSEVASFRQDPDLFFASRPGPLLLDEVQQVPDILPYLEREVDRVPGRSRFSVVREPALPADAGGSSTAPRPERGRRGGCGPSGGSMETRLPSASLISLHPVVEEVERGVWNLPLGLLLAGLPGDWLDARDPQCPHAPPAPLATHLPLRPVPPLASRPGPDRLARPAAGHRRRSRALPLPGLPGTASLTPGSIPQGWSLTSYTHTLPVQAGW